jgi:hypothetical protein
MEIRRGPDCVLGKVLVSGLADAACAAGNNGRTRKCACWTDAPHRLEGDCLGEFVLKI